MLDTTDDREKALSCLQRRKQREREMKLASGQLLEQEKVIAKVQRSIDESGNRVQALQNQRNQMRSREAASRAGQIVQALDGRVGSDVEAAIERWEVSVGEIELLNDSAEYASQQSDDLAQAFISAEENQQLEAELDELLQREGENHE